MKGYLLDTNIVLWAGDQPERLSPAATRALEAGPVWLSVISYWEVVIKAGRGRLEIGDTRRWWSSALDHLAALPLSLLPEHVAAVGLLPPLHQDPFDRALVAQALTSELVLISTDRDVARYRSTGLQILL